MMMLVTGKNRNSPSEGGFTLIEVLLSVALLAIGLVWILQGYGSVIQAVRKSRLLTEGSRLLQEKMAEKEIKIRTGETLGGGDSGVENRLEWSTQVTETTEEKWYELKGEVHGNGEKITVMTYVRQ